MNFLEGKVYVMPTQSDTIIKNSTIIDDRSSLKYTIDPFSNDIPKKNYLLKYYDGSNTLPTFKKLITTNSFNIIIIFVDNLESFYHNFSILMDYNFIYIDKKKITKKRVKQYYKMLKSIDNKCDISDDNKSGLSISFMPDILSSVQSSLEKPSMYFESTNTIPSRIFLSLKESPKTYTELNLMKIKDLKRQIKSLIFCNIIEKRNEYYYVKLDIL